MAETFHCPSCGASITGKVASCMYCGSTLVDINRHMSEEKHIPQKNNYDFGFNNNWLQWVLVVVAGIASAIATVFDGTSFFSNNYSMGAWFGMIPLVFFITGIVKSSRLGAVLVFIALFLATGGSFAVINIIRLNFGYIDDSIGIGSVIGGAASFSYLLGIVVHKAICYKGTSMD